MWGPWGACSPFPKTLSRPSVSSGLMHIQNFFLVFSILGTSWKKSTQGSKYREGWRTPHTKLFFTRYLNHFFGNERGNVVFIFFPRIFRKKFFLHTALKLVSSEIKKTIF